MKYSYVYIMSNNNSSTLYIGVTSDLIKRVHEHKQGLGSIFTSKYKTYKLVYYEIFEDIKEAIDREKQLKGGSRAKKVKLIQQKNLFFKDLYEEIVF